MGTKTFYIQTGIGKARYVVNFHNGEKQHRDGSKFYDLKIFNNKREMGRFVTTLRNDGYVEH